MSNVYELNKSLFKVENIWVVVEDKKIPHVLIDGTHGNFLCLDELQYGFKESHVTHVVNCNGCRKIIATCGVEIPGIPQFYNPLNGDYAHSATTQFKLYLNKLLNVIPGDIHNELWNHLMDCIGEKEAAKEKFKFTEEDLRNAFQAGQNKGANHMNMLLKTGELTFTPFEDYLRFINENRTIQWIKFEEDIIYSADNKPFLKVKDYGTK